MKIPKRFSPKRLFRSKKNNLSSSADVSRSDPPSFGSATSSSSSSDAAGSATPTTVLPDSSQNDAVVSRKELEAILYRIASSEDEVAMMLSELGGDGLIRLEAVLDRVGSGLGSPIESELRETFEFFDADQDGRITAEELHGAFRSMGDEGCTLADCRRMIEDVDENGNGFVCFAEFVRMMELQSNYVNHTKLTPHLGSLVLVGDRHFPPPTISFHSHVLPRFLLSPNPSKLFSLLPSHYLTKTHFPQPFLSPTHSLPLLLLLLQSCQTLHNLKPIHARIVVSSGSDAVSLASTLIRLYANFSDLPSAVSVLDAFPAPEPVLWNSVVKSHLDSGLFLPALLLYKKMRELGVSHDGFTFPIVNDLIMCIWVDVVYAGMVHCVGIRMGFGVDLYFCNTMMGVYAKCGCLVCARKLFDEMPQRDLVSWTLMMSAYVNGGDVVCGLDLFEGMRRELEPNSVTIMVMVQGCCVTGDLVLGRQFQCYVVKNGLLFDIGLRNSILRMYSRLGGEDDVGVFFSEIDCKNVVSWNILLSFYSSVRDIVKVVDIFNKIMGEVSLNIETLTILVSAIATSDLKYLILGENLHSLAIKTGLYDGILWTSLLDMYAKFGELENSTRLFKEIPYRSIVTWGAMMSSFIQNGHFDEAVEIFNQMQATGLKPSVGILKLLMDAYTNLGALQLGKAIHCNLIRTYGLKIGNTHFETSLLNMYVRCGSIASARKCFDLILVKDVVAWTSMIEGYGAHGLGFNALNLFHQMLSEEVAPNHVTFLSLLSACSHSGLVSEGCEIFYSMRSRFNIKPDLEHYTCFIDLLSRSTRLREAFAIVLRLPNLCDGRIWGALMAACRVYGDNKIAHYAAQRLLELEPDNVGYYTLLSNAQASVGQWNEVEKLRSVVHEKYLVKKPGWSFIELKGTIHGFVSGDRSHNQTKEIYDLLAYFNTME